jgi:photosystem II stability/assembly factor-like uncharacterized protein
MNNRFLVSTRKGLFDVRRGAGGWKIHRAAFVGDNCTLVMHDPRSGYLYAALDHGHFGVKLHRSSDGGDSWSEVAVPVYPEKPADFNPPPPPFGKPVEWSLKLIWALEPGGTDQPGVIWCGTLPGGLFRSDDHGDSWTLNRPLWDEPRRAYWVGGGADSPGIHSICVDPRDSRHISVAVSCGGAWITRDGGETWDVCGKGMRAAFMPPEMQYEPVAQDPHLMVQCPSNPDALWIQHHNGIFRSVDAAASWEEITDVQPSVFGFAVAVHPRDPETAWFVPAVKDEKRYPADARVVVTRTRDGGRSFDTLSRGLPQEHAYDLVYRHALDIDQSGERLAFGSTTGSLWVSEDAGDSWSTVSANLPPIYSVRFVKGA